MSTDSSRTASVLSTRPSTGTTSPGPTTRASPAVISLRGTSPRRRRCDGGPSAARVRAGRAGRGRRVVERPSRVRPVASMSAIRTPARYSPTARVPPSASTAIRSTPACPRRSATSTQPTAGMTAATVPSPQKSSAMPSASRKWATPPPVRAAVVTARSPRSRRGTRAPPSSGAVARRGESGPWAPRSVRRGNVDPLTPWKRGAPP